MILSATKLMLKGRGVPFKLHMNKEYGQGSHNRKKTVSSVDENERRKQRAQREKRKKQKILVFRIKVTICTIAMLITWNIGKSIFQWMFQNIGSKNESKIVVTEEISEIIDDRVSFLAVGDNIGHDRVHAYGDTQAGVEFV